MTAPLRLFSKQKAQSLTEGGTRYQGLYFLSASFSVSVELCVAFCAALCSWLELLRTEQSVQGLDEQAVLRLVHACLQCL
jgi:hypothetical protein